MWKDELQTPAVTIDLAILDANLRNTAALAAAAGIKLRPHIKTHKSIWIARKQLAYGAVGITVAKLGEAEVMATAGIQNILIAFPLIGAPKLQRLAKLIDQGVEAIVSIDSVEAAQGLSELAVAKGITIPLYVDINTGLNRCGREPGEPSAELALAIAALPHVEIRGLMTHAGHAYSCTEVDSIRQVARHEAASLIATQQALAARGIQVPEISVGSTPTSKFAAELDGITEMRPGAYVYGDGSQLYPGLITEQQCAMRIYATVVSTPRPGTAIIDAGSKTITNDVSPHRRGYGYLPDYPEVFIERLSEEHGILSVPEHTSLEIGDIVSIIPNHCCTVANLHQHLLGIGPAGVEQLIAVDARGQVT